MIRWCPAACVAAILLAPHAARAQGGEPGAPVYSMGQPPLWRPYTVAGWQRGAGGLLLAGVEHPILNPVTGLLGVAAEGYALSTGGGARLLATAPALALSAGIDWQARRGGVAPVVSWQSAIRRGGLLGHGTMLRLDWLPTRGQRLGVGIHVPLAQPFAGRTRQRATAARLAAAPRGSSEGADAAVEPPAADSALAAVDTAARLIRAYTNLYSADNERLLLEARRSYAAVTRQYHIALARAFRAAAGDSARGDEAAGRARAILLDRVLLPYDSLFGQVKLGGVQGLIAAAQSAFGRWAADSSGLDARGRSAVSGVTARWLHAVEGVHDDLLSQWGDSRRVWLPVQLALVPDEYDEQEEVDSLIGRFVGHPFTDDNALVYLSSADLPLEIARSIYAARDYHVLWTHDFSGRLPSGAVDMTGYAMVADAYLPALTAAVQRYDSTGRLPVYMILLDEYFYEPRAGRMWMDILEDPLNAPLRVRGLDSASAAHLRDRQRALRAAVAASRRLQADAARLGGAGWLRRTVKVHVDINLPSDFSFRSERIMPPVPFTPDNVMRDHRKIVLYDVDEANPWRGAMFVMGVGIGEQYASADWEDRGYRIRGPVTLETRAALRRQLRLNGFRDDQIPDPLRPVRSATSVERSLDVGEYAGRALQVHNEPGFAAKQSSIARALLYELAPPGSVLIVPDPLWLSRTWAAMLAGAAARGCRVFVIAPAVVNAPSPQAPLMAEEHDVMLRLLRIGDLMRAQWWDGGGELRVGLFAAHASPADAAGRAREVRQGLASAPWIRTLIPFDDRTLAVLDQATTQTGADAKDASALAPHEPPHPPQLHQKTLFIARPGAIAALVRQPGWDAVLARTMRVQSAQTARFAEQFGWTRPDIDTAAIRRSDAMLRGFVQSLSDAERKRVSFYFSVGSQNEDPRGLMLDGESSVLVSGFDGAVGLVDLYFLMARSTWISSQTELERYVPRQSGLMRALASLLHPTF